MPDETGTETTNPDALNVAECLFRDSADDADVEAAAPVEEEDCNRETCLETEESDDAGEQAAAGDAETPEELKVVLSIRGGRATIGVQQTSSDPHIESFDGLDLSALAQEVAAVTERARVMWENEPRHPAHERPAPPSRRRNRREPAAAQAETAGEEEDQQQPETLRLF